jgi:hypothetical protein
MVSEMCLRRDACASAERNDWAAASGLTRACHFWLNERVAPTTTYVNDGLFRPAVLLFAHRTRVYAPTIHHVVCGQEERRRGTRG